MNAFDAIKETLRIKEVLAYYGVIINRGNKALCPLHNEKSPSFTVYPNNNSWHCFGCNVGGSIIDFVMAYCGVNAREAAKKLDIDFNLKLFDNKRSQEEIQKQSEEKACSQVCTELAEYFDTYINKAYGFLCTYFHLLADWKIQYAPASPEEMEKYISPLFIEACDQLDYIEYLIDCLMLADFNDQIHFYQAHRKEVERIARKVKQHSESRNADESTQQRFNITYNH